MKQILVVLVVLGAGVAMYVIFSNDVEKGKEEEPYDIKEQKKRSGSQAEEDRAKDRMGSDKQTEGQPGSGWPTDPASIPTDPDEIRGGQQK